MGRTKKYHKRNESNKHCYPSSSSSCSSDSNCVVDDRSAKEVEAIWDEAFSGAILLPVIGFPSNSGGVGTLTHGMGDGILLHINGLPSKSPLSNNALYSFECSQGHYLNLYEIMLPDIPGRDGEDSTVEIYVKLLYKYGLSVAGVHFHWWGQNLVRGNTLISAIHHQAIDMDPKEFSRKTIKALKKTMEVIDRRSGHSGHGGH